MRAYTVSVRYGRVPNEMRTSPAALTSRARRAAVSAAMPYVHRRLALVTPVGATGKARQSLTMERGPDPGRGFVGYAGMPGTYIGFVNSGTRPFMPPRYVVQGPLAYWVARKFGYPLGSPQARRVAYLVARKISRRGIRAQRFIETLVMKERSRAQQLMIAAALDALNRPEVR